MSNEFDGHKIQLTQHQIAIIRESFERLSEQLEHTSPNFYKKFFELEPSARVLFEEDIRVQNHKLFQLLILSVEGLDDLDALSRELVEVGRRHARRGVTIEYMPAFGTALLWAMKQDLDGKFTPELQQAWLTLYELLAAKISEGIMFR